MSEPERYETNMSWGYDDHAAPATARFSSRCPACARVIDRGDRIVMNQGRFVHEHCEDAWMPVLRSEPKAPGVCPTCRMELPVTGECGVC